MRIGIDVGGTNTDAVLMDGRRVLAEAKTPTTADVTGGIVAALRSADQSAGGVDASQVHAVMIGTTHFTNAVVEARRLVPTARDPARAFRRRQRCRRWSDWPTDLRAGARRARLPLPRRPRVRRPRDRAARP